MAKKKKQTDNLVDDVVKTGTKIAGKVVEKAADILNLKGEVSQDRFIERTKQAFEVFNKAGYVRPGGAKGQVKYVDYKIGASQVDNRKQNYVKEFARLHSYIKDRMNEYNPGLGDLWATAYPEFTLVNQGNISKAGAWEDFVDLVNAYPPGSYKPTFQELAKNQANVTANETAAKSKAADAPIVVSKEKLSYANELKLIPLRSTMSNALLAIGAVPPTDIESLAELFYTQIVQKGTGSNYETDYLDNQMTNEIIAFCATLKAKQLAGETLPKLYEGIAKDTNKAEQKLSTDLTISSVGSGLFSNPIVWILLLVLIIMLAKSK